MKNDRIEPINEKIPDALISGSIEFFVYDGDIFCLHNGKVYPFDEIPERIINKVRNDMKKNKKAIKALNNWKILDEQKRMRQYISCRFGAFDNAPDISETGEAINTEYFNCGNRGRCAYEGIICQKIAVKTGVLNKREITALKMIGRGMQDREICIELGISENTFRHTKDSLRKKSGFAGKPALAVLAHKLNLI